MQWRVGPFRVDGDHACVWRGEARLVLRPKTFDLLVYLLEHAGELVTKDALLAAVWPETVVAESVLTVSMSELRKVLGETARAPQFIATVHRRGYRFIAPVVAEGSALPLAAAVAAGAPLPRRLAAILSADVQGYSRLMEDDDQATVHTLHTYRAVMATHIAQHHGRVVDASGDNLLAEFASAVEAVACAVAMQAELRQRNQALPAARQMWLRMGITLGEVLVEGEQLYGEGVDLAARLEGLAEGGGVCISGTVYEYIETRLPLAYTDLGEHVVKNITRPVRVYRVEPLSAAVAAERRTLSPAWQLAGSRVVRPVLHLVSRETELAQLHACWAQALRGERQVVFITGEAGIGKTTLVDALVAQLAGTPVPWIGHGQCIEHYGAGEPYLPLLEALGGLCRGAERTHLIARLSQLAPSWLLQMPALLSAAEYDTLQRRMVGATRERMVRELAEAVETLTAQRPLVLVLEDLHWSDVSTLDWLNYVARRRQPARLLFLGTYRPVDAVVRDHRVRAVTQELSVHGYGTELALDYLSAAGVATYLHQRLESAPVPDAWVQHLYQRTHGNPLFLRTIGGHAAKARP